MCRSKAAFESERVIRVDRGAVEYTSLGPGRQYPDNNVISSKYTWYNFIPKNLSEQFSNLANLYFLLVGVLQIIPQISTTNGIPTMYQPLAFIVVVSAARALSEDIQKHRADSKRNSYGYDVVRVNPVEGTTYWSNVKSGDLAVGDIVRIKQNEMIPTDMLFLGSSMPQGHCFIDKANLNGETKLEVYSSIRETRFFCPPMPDVSGMSSEEKDSYLNLPPAPEFMDLSLELAYELPNKRFDSFRGAMVMKDQFGQFKEIKCDGSYLLMRETNLKNTEFIYGMVVYTGDDTKIQRSNLEGEKAKVKVSHVMRLVNNLLVYMFIAQGLFCLVCGIVAGVWAKDHSNDWYMYYNSGNGLTGNDHIVTGVLAFFTWYINLSQMVPISLIVSAEMVKFIMSMFINADITLYHAPINKPTHCNSSTIHEDLGLIDYIFSDKTGTLTQNKMEFRYALVSDGTEYGSKITDIAKAVMQRNKELEDRAAGVYKPKAMDRWTDLLKPHVSRRMRNYDNHYDIDCCEQFFPRWLHGLWMNFKPANDSVHHSSVHVFNKSGDGDYMAADFEPSSPVAEEAPPVSSDNCFTEAERVILLQALYGHKDPSVSVEDHERKREALHRYMIHMTLSNTVKPYYEDGKLQFQPESAEELAMVEFANKCGFTKLPEKEEKDKTEEEKRTGGNTRISIQHYDTALQPVGEPVIHTYSFLACLGFTSARARVTVIYQEASTQNILVMTKGQDTTVLPFLDFSMMGHKFEEALLANLTDLCNNGLRTLVAAHAEQPPEWWDKLGPEYSKLKEMSDGDDNAKKKLEHELFERIEREANLQYLGCIGMEDQLQPLVPESIAAYLHAGIKVWMITGDKLETAKNIALACNLIDADMQPSIKAGESMKEAMSAYADSRLITVTGEWNSLFENRDELSALFESMDYNGNGFINADDLSILLTSLHSGISQERINVTLNKLFSETEMKHMLDQNFGVDELPTHSHTNRASFSQSSRKSGVDKDGFMYIMQQFKRSPFEAVSYDVDEGIKRYNRIQDHEAYPISLLVNRDAFLVMYPGRPVKRKAASKQAQGADEDPHAPDEFQLEDLRRKFFFLASVSKSVVFARAQPAMKKKMVTEIQARVPTAITLAIGDGANDTDMITAAHVGIGIAGVEGTAATNSSDYAIGTFRMLHTLLFAHGFWSYNRVANLVTFIFYKATLLAITQFFFGIYSGFSGQQFFNDPIYQLYNVMYTALPIISLSVFDKALPKNTCEDNPAAFREQKGNVFNGYIFATWIFRALLHSAIAFFVPLYAMDGFVLSIDGQTIDIWYFSTVVFNILSFLPTFLIFFLMQSIQIIHIATIIVSIFCIMLVTYIVSTPAFNWLNPDLTGVISKQYASPTYWLVTILCVVICLMLEMGYRYVMRQVSPDFTQILQEKLAKARLDDKLQSKLYNLTLPEVDAIELYKPRPVISPEEEKQWAAAKVSFVPKTKDRNLKSMAQILQTLEEQGDDDSQEEQLRGALVRAMLRFRSNTGSQFDSAAQSKYQTHDTFISPSSGPIGGRNLVDGVPSSSLNTLRHSNRRTTSSAPPPSNPTPSNRSRRGMVDGNSSITQPLNPGNRGGAYGI